jgi:gamma-glutamyltranspeptidase/glutathione hydrolase
MQRIISLLTLATVTACASLQTQQKEIVAVPFVDVAHAAVKKSTSTKESIQPESYYKWAPKPAVRAKHYMIVTPHPLATEVGEAVLAKGGTAVDAAIAASVMLTLVEPFASGIGGGGYMLVYDAKTRQTVAFDGRETAPDSASEKMFLDKKGRPQEFFSAVVGGKSVGVPGLLKMLEDAHGKYGRTQWFDLLYPTAIAARQGFAVSERLHYQLENEPYLSTIPASRAYFYDGNGKPWRVGHTLKNPLLGETIHRIAVNGAKEFYQGDTTDLMLAAVNKAPVNRGKLTISDFLDYTALEKHPVCNGYRVYKICGVPPSSGGGIVTLQTLALLEKTPFNKAKPDSAEAIHLVAEASALAYADRNRYIADPAFVSYKQTALLDKRYVASRAKLIHSTKTLGTATAGQPFGKKYAGDYTQFEPVSTSHISVVDRYGNAVSLTASVENTFGSRLFAAGFILNNELTDFAFVPIEKGKKVANCVQPNKRPRSSMSPTFVFDNKGKLKMVVGSPGGARITPFVVKTLVEVLDWHKPLEAALASPHYVDRNGDLELEEKRFSPRIISALQTKGHKVVEANLTSGVNAIYIEDNGTLVGVSDPRREGTAAGR